MLLFRAGLPADTRAPATFFAVRPQPSRTVTRPPSPASGGASLGPNDPVEEAEGYSRTVYRECDLCESLTDLTESHGLFVCGSCEERLLP